MSQDWCNKSKAVRSLVLDEEKIRPGHWLVVVLAISLRASTLMIGWQNGHPACKDLIPWTFSFRTRGGGDFKQKW